MKIRITGAVKKAYWYAERIGEVFDAEYGKFYGEWQYRVEDCRDGTDYAGIVDVKDCEVVTDVTASEDAALLVLARKINEQATLIDGLTDAVGRLTLKVAELERAKTSIGAKELPSYVKVASGPVSDALPSFASRDDVIAKAKRDVAALALADKYNEVRRKESGKEGPFYLYDSVYGTYAEFIVNSDKRTVVCLLRGYTSHDVLTRGIAKCAPGDVFNSHIGRAIALRRALGLEVPTECTNAPAPREPRVGDIVEYSVNRYEIVTGPVRGYQAQLRSEVAQKGRIIDDSRENGTEVAL